MTRTGAVYPAATDLVILLKTDYVIQTGFHQVFYCGQTGTACADDCYAHVLVNSEEIENASQKSTSIIKVLHCRIRLCNGHMEQAQDIHNFILCLIT